jgi:hypothetical protein
LNSPSSFNDVALLFCRVFGAQRGERVLSGLLLSSPVLSEFFY